MALGIKSSAVAAPTRHDAPFEGGAPSYNVDVEGGDERKSSRIGSDTDSTLSVGKQIELEANNAIKYRTCSWPKTAALLFSEYICLAIMSFPWSYSVLGLFPGILLTIVVAALVLYTSLVIWEFCLRNPDVKDVCDIGQKLFWGKRWAWYFTAVMFLLNNTFIQGLHVLVGAKYLNTMTNHNACTVVFGVITTIISFVCSLPRTFSTLSKIATASAFFTFISVLLATIFSGIESHPLGYNTGVKNPTTGLPMTGEPTVLAFPAKGTTFVAGMTAFLNISYTFIGQITIPSFIYEMKEPRDFPKALWAVTIAEIIVFSLVGALMYHFTGNQYMTSPAFGSIGNEVYKKVAFSFMIPTLIFLGVLYASVSARFIFFQLFDGTRHKGSHTLIGWSSWTLILAVTWIGAFIIAEVIPFFSDLLSLMSSLFDCFFGFIFWGVAFFRIRSSDKRKGVVGTWVVKDTYLNWALNGIIILIGFYFLTAGTYTTVQSIINGYRSGSVGGVFTCASNGL